MLEFKKTAGQWRSRGDGDGMMRGDRIKEEADGGRSQGTVMDEWGRGEKTLGIE